MTPSQEEHLGLLKSKIQMDLDEKYRAGQKEHGGCLWNRPVVKDLKSEVVDLVAYTYTLEMNLREATMLLDKIAANCKTMTPLEVLTDVRQALRLINGRNYTG